MAKHPLVAKISLTGSTEVGRTVMHYAADRILNATMELGGKNPQIVFSDCDDDETVKGVMQAVRFVRQGQSCSSGSRINVHRSIFDSFVARLAAAVAKYKVRRRLRRGKRHGGHHEPGAI